MRLVHGGELSSKGVINNEFGVIRGPYIQLLNPGGISCRQWKTSIRSRPPRKPLLLHFLGSVERWNIRRFSCPAQLLRKYFSRGICSRMIKKAEVTKKFLRISPKGLKNRPLRLRRC